MGTEITLELRGLTLSYSKNDRGWDHGSLFQEKDRSVRPVRRSRSGNDDDVDTTREFRRRLGEVLPRLDLLGFTLDRAHREYARLASSWVECRRELDDGDEHNPLDPMTFAEFRGFIARHPLAKLNTRFVSLHNEQKRARLAQRFGGEAEIGKIPRMDCEEYPDWSEAALFGGLINILHPYFTLRLLGEVPANRRCELIWEYGSLVDAGWAAESDFEPSARRRETFLIATEGSSDVHILQRALQLLRPDVSDFFRFIDVTESHPFSGTGNLVKFGEGLVKIDVHNQILFVFDNDAEGVSASRRLARLRFPPNMRVLVLPDLNEFRTFRTRGPEGPMIADINGRAAAIECYLDLCLKGRTPAQVLWKSHREDLDVYHGALEFKESYVKHFLEQGPKAVERRGYDFSKLAIVLDHLIKACSELSAEVSGTARAAHNDKLGS